MSEITRIITPCRCGKCIYCEFGGNPPPQIIEKETACGDCERKDKLIEKMLEALKVILRYPMLPIELDEIADAALAAEGEKTNEQDTENR